MTPQRLEVSFNAHGQSYHIYIYKRDNIQLSF